MLNGFLLLGSHAFTFSFLPKLAIENKEYPNKWGNSVFDTTMK
jgi:hypothetical protein